MDKDSLRKLQIFAKICIKVNIAILIIQVFLGMHPGLVISIIPLVIYQIPLLLMTTADLSSHHRYLYTIYLASYAHIVLLILFASYLLISIFFPGLLLITLFGLGGLLSSWIASCGMSFVFIIQGLVWTLFISRIINRWHKENIIRKNLKFVLLPLLFVLLYIPSTIYIYTIFQAFLIPAFSPFWDSWIIN